MKIDRHIPGYPCSADRWQAPRPACAAVRGVRCAGWLWLMMLSAAIAGPPENTPQTSPKQSSPAQTAAAQTAVEATEGNDSASELTLRNEAAGQVPGGLTPIDEGAGSKGAGSEGVGSEGAGSEGAAAERAARERKANLLLQRVLTQLVHGPAFDAKVRQTVWTGGREVVGVGTYEQSGEGSGRFNLQVTMHDGDGKHRLHQVSDGRLAWTRTDIAGAVSLRRVDVGRLDQWVKGVSEEMPVAPRLLVGAWAEMLDTIRRDYRLEVAGAHLKERPVWVIRGELREKRREEVKAEAGRDSWPPLYPTRVRIAIQSQPDPETGFGHGLPLRLEYWSDPVADREVEPSRPQGRLVTLVEIYSIRPIESPPAERFRFENQDAEVNFINDTDRYIQLYGVELTERQRRQLRR